MSYHIKSDKKSTRIISTVRKVNPPQHSKRDDTKLAPRIDPREFFHDDWQRDIDASFDREH